ncbi:MAG TPA: LPS export ABC transporter permease LptF [Candidatus Acidoferrales bacterium]|nr:LPS export ABC transporter permease LptF [Candidatus Acidoferrales bacterium]
MRILDRYIFREVIADSWLGLAVFTFVFFVPQLVRLMNLVVQHAATAKETATLVLCSLPPVLIFTIPMSMLVGVLIGLGRLSADSEIVALNASGVSLRRLLLPIGGIALAATILTFFITLWLGPLSLRTLTSLEDRLRVSQASLAIQPRVFDERFPHLVLYVEDVAASGMHWRGVFLADSSSSTVSKITVARNAIVAADPRTGKMSLHLDDVSSHEYDPQNPAHYDLSTSADESMNLPFSGSDNAANSPRAPNDRERTVHQLLSVSGPAAARTARAEFQQRIALPIACLIFALLGVPVGVRPRRGGRAAGFVITILLICGYYLFFVTGVHFAQNGMLSPVIGVWTANIIAFAVALVLLRRIEHIHPEARWLDHLRRSLLHQRKMRREVARETPANSPAIVRATLQIEPSRRRKYRTWAFPLIFDQYVLGTFFYWIVLMLASFMILFDAFTLFDLLGDIAKNHIPISVVVNYFAHLLPMMVYQLLPLAALVATLITLGLLAKNNEITAFRASGVSLFRLALPLILAGVLLSGAMFLLDDSILPYANQRQDALHDRIKGRPAETYFQPTHQWIFGAHDNIYNYQLFDPDNNSFGGLNVFELNPSTFQIQRRIYANRAYWEPNLNSWILEEGWVRDFSDSSVRSYTPFRVDSFAQVSEQPSYFKREVFQYNQMNWWQLRSYIRNLQKAGFETSRLSVEWHKKIAFPLIATIIVFLAIPFSLLVGTRGAVGGIALAVGIGIAYWSIAALFEALGAVGQLPPFLAAWAPDAVFAFAGLYFFLKMPT